MTKWRNGWQWETKKPEDFVNTFSRAGEGGFKELSKYIASTPAIRYRSAAAPKPVPLEFNSRAARRKNSSEGARQPFHRYQARSRSRVRSHSSVNTAYLPLWTTGINNPAAEA